MYSIDVDREIKAPCQATFCFDLLCPKKNIFQKETTSQRFRQQWRARRQEKDRIGDLGYRGSRIWLFWPAAVY